MHIYVVPVKSSPPFEGTKRRSLRTHESNTCFGEDAICFIISGGVYWLSLYNLYKSLL